MAISIPNNKLVKPAHDFDEKPGVAKVAITGAGPLSVATTGSDPSGAALFERTVGANNEGYIGMGMIDTPIKGGVAALRNTIIAGFLGVLPGKEVFLGQDGSLTQNIIASNIVAPASAPTLAQSAGAGVLAAGTYKVAYSWVDTATGETITSPVQTITIIASKQIDVTAVTPMPTAVDSVNWYMSVAAGSAVLKLVANNVGAAFSINALGTGASPLTSVAVQGTRRVGIGFTPYLIAFD